MFNFSKGSDRAAQACPGRRWATMGPQLCHNGPQWRHNGATIGPQWRYNGATMAPQWGHNGATMGPQWATMAPQWGHNGPQWGHNGAAMAPQWGHNGPQWRHNEYLAITGAGKGYPTGFFFFAITVDLKRSIFQKDLTELPRRAQDGGERR